jgi:hypothetical protein
VRPCIGSSQSCTVYIGGEDPHISCVVNASAGYENTVPLELVPNPSSRRLKVLVAGGGPAGLEAARTLAIGNHEVHLAEMTARLGGQVAIAASAPFRGDYGAITNWLSGEVERLKVNVMLRTFAEPDLIDELAPDVIIVATGSTPRRDGFCAARPGHRLQGVNLPHVYTSWDVLGFGGRAEIGSSSVVYDDTGSYELICVCERLLEAGGDVTLVTRFDRFPAMVAGSSSLVDSTALPARERLMTNPRFHLMAERFISEITATDVALDMIHPGGVPVRFQADTVVVLGYNHPNRELGEALEDSGIPVHVVGDASGTRTLHAAMRKATLVARNIDAMSGSLIAAR